MDFTIVTPSYQQLDWLGCCIASVADQECVSLEHIVQDAGTEGFVEFSEKMRHFWPDRPGYRRMMVSEPDQGMYDAINKGLGKGKGKICAYLNCDEQYLPGALARVKEGFGKHPGTEILYGGFLVVDERGQLVTARRPVRMFWQHVATSHLPNFTCATFFRRSMLERDQAWFDPSYRACGDAAWTVGRLQKKASTRNLPYYLSAFTERSNNQGMQLPGWQEAQRLRQQAPHGVRLSSLLWTFCHRIQKAMQGHYQKTEVTYELYTRDAERLRTTFHNAKASPIWKSRFGWSPRTRA